MDDEGLISIYTVAQYKVHTTTSNESPVGNELDRDFDNKLKLEAIVSDLTYVRVNNRWNYICTIIYLYNRETIGYSVGVSKNAQLVKRALSKIKDRLDYIRLFHTDCGKEFINKEIDRLLTEFDIKR